MKVQRHTKKEWKTKTGVQLYLWKRIEKPKEKTHSLQKRKQERANDHGDIYDPFL